MIHLTDAQQAFADSPRGQNHVALAKRTHTNREAYKGKAAAPWTDAMQAAAIRDGAITYGRADLEQARQGISGPGAADVGRAARDTALMMRRAATTTAWQR